MTTRIASAPSLRRKTQRGVDQLAEAIAVLPDPAADRDQADADADIGQDIDRALHRVGDGEVGVFALVEMPNEQNAAGKSDHLHGGLHERETADDAGALQRATDERRGSFIQDRRRNRAEETHRWIRADGGPSEIAVRRSGRALGRLNLFRLMLTMRSGRRHVFFDRTGVL